MAKRPGTVRATGADAQSFLIGVEEEPLNVGLRIRIDHRQPKGHGGPIVGSFFLQKAGYGTYWKALMQFEGQRFPSADALITKVQKDRKKSLYVLHCNKLRVDPNQ